MALIGFVEVSKGVHSLWQKAKEIFIMTSDLLTKPTGRIIRFDFAVTIPCPIVLMIGDLTKKNGDLKKPYSQDLHYT